MRDDNALDQLDQPMIGRDKHGRACYGLKALYCDPWTGLRLEEWPTHPSAPAWWTRLRLQCSWSRVVHGCNAMPTTKSDVLNGISQVQARLDAIGVVTEVASAAISRLDLCTDYQGPASAPACRRMVKVLAPGRMEYWEAGDEDKSVYLGRKSLVIGGYDKGAERNRRARRHRQRLVDAATIAKVNGVTIFRLELKTMGAQAVQRRYGIKTPDQLVEVYDSLAEVFKRVLLKKVFRYTVEQLTLTKTRVSESRVKDILKDSVARWHKRGRAENLRACRLWTIYRDEGVERLNAALKRGRGLTGRQVSYLMAQVRLAAAQDAAVDDPEFLPCYVELRETVLNTQVLGTQEAIMQAATADAHESVHSGPNVAPIDRRRRRELGRIDDNAYVSVDLPSPAADSSPSWSDGVPIPIPSTWPPSMLAPPGGRSLRYAA